MSKIFKDTIEFYITNVCNFNCSNCNRLNNYYFSGYEKWQDYEKIYQTWSEKVNFGAISILGGEPTLNHTLDQWILGLRRLWPNAEMGLLSNGSRLKYWHQRGLFDILSQTNTTLQITLHNRSRLDSFIEEVKSYLKDPVSMVQEIDSIPWIDSYNNVKDKSWPDCNSYQDFQNLPDWIQAECRDVHKIDWDDWIKDTGSFRVYDRADPDIVIRVDYAEDFVTAPLKYVGNNKFSVYDSDPEIAHRECWSKDCTHMMKGKMYKCHHVALLPDFAKQFEVIWSESDQALIKDYRPLEADADPAEMQAFVDNLINAMPQCKVCPSKLEKVSLKSDTNKPKIAKIIPIKSAGVAQW